MRRSPSSPSQNACRLSVAAFMGVTVSALPPLSPGSAAVNREVACKGWWASPTRWMSHTRCGSYRQQRTRTSELAIRAPGTAVLPGRQAVRPLPAWRSAEIYGGPSKDDRRSLMPKRVALRNAKQLANWKPAKAGEELIDGAVLARPPFRQRAELVPEYPHEWEAATDRAGVWAWAG